MKTRSLALFFCSILLLLASCASLMGPRTVEIPLSSLQQSLASQFPFNNRYLDLLDITITNPRVSLQPETNRLVTSMDAVIAPPFLNRALNGSFTVSGNLGLDPARNALVLRQPQVEQFAVSGLDPLYANRIGKVGSLIAEQFLQNIPVYTFAPGQLRYAGTDFNLSKITTTPGSLMVTFEPAR